MGKNCFTPFKKKVSKCTVLAKPSRAGHQACRTAHAASSWGVLPSWAVSGVIGVVHEKRPDREMMKPCHIQVESGRSHETADSLWV